MNWFKLHSEFAFDPKVQSMSHAMQRHLIMLFCLQSCDALVTLGDDEIAVTLRVTEDELVEIKALFKKKGFVTGDACKLKNWEKRQYRQDSSKERTRRWREKRLVTEKPSPVTPVTALDTDNRIQKEIKIETKVSTKKNSRRKISYSVEMEEFWKGYPLNGASKTEASKSYLKAINEGATHEEIINGTKKYRNYLERTGTTVAHATTWLNQGRWTIEYDSLTAEPKLYPSTAGKPSRLDIIQGAVRASRGQG